MNKVIKHRTIGPKLHFNFDNYTTISRDVPNNFKGQFIDLVRFYKIQKQLFKDFGHNF